MALQCGISAISARTECVQWRTEYKTGTLPYICGKPVKPLGYAECTPVHQKRLNFPYNSFRLCFDFSGRRICCKAEKRKQGHCLPQLPATIRAPFRPIATFSFFRFGVGGVVARKERENRKQERGLQRALPLPLGERLTLDIDCSLRKSMSRVLWRYCWHNSKNTTAKGDYTYERKTHFPLSRQRKPYPQQP